MSSRTLLFSSCLAKGLIQASSELHQLKLHTFVAIAEHVPYWLLKRIHVLTWVYHCLQQMLPNQRTRLSLRVTIEKHFSSANANYPVTGFVTGMAFPDPLTVFLIFIVWGSDFSLIKSLFFPFELDFPVVAHFTLGGIFTSGENSTSIYFRHSSFCTYHQTTQVSLTLLYTHSQCHCCSLCSAGRKQDEITVIYYLPITGESGLWWLVHGYIRCLRQSRN